MHNLHLIRVTANSPEYACDYAESSLEEYGGENNYYAICGCISEDNEIYDMPQTNGRYTPSTTIEVNPNSVKFATDTNVTPLEQLNKKVMGWMGIDPDFSQKVKSNLEKHWKGEELLSSEWYGIEEYVKSNRNISYTDTKNFDVLSDSFCEFDYAECGVTGISDDAVEDEKIYIVFIDMHS